MGVSIMNINKVGILILSIILLIMFSSIELVQADTTPPSPPPMLIFGSGPIPPPAPPPAPSTPPGNDGLLSGMTPSQDSLPSGWSRVRKQDFEGNCPSDEWCGRWDGSATTTKPHLGSKSVEGTYNHDQADVGWNMSGSSVGSFSEIYLSYYEFTESQALYNTEYWIAQFKVDNPFQEVIPVWLWPKNANNQPTLNGVKSTFYFSVQGSYTNRYGGKTDYPPAGVWVQWEVWYRPNSGGSSNGFIRVYKNGVLYISAENKNLNGNVSMNNAYVQVGGVYTKQIWMTDNPTCTQCSSASGIGTDYCTGNWPNQSFSQPVCGPSLPSFKRYFDDIIVMKK